MSSQLVKNLRLSESVITDLNDLSNTISSSYVHKDGTQDIGTIQLDGIAIVNDLSSKNTFINGKDNTVLNSNSTAMGLSAIVIGTSSAAIGYQVKSGANGYNIISYIENLKDDSTVSSYTFNIDTTRGQIDPAIIGLKYSLAIMNSAVDVGTVLDIDNTKSTILVDTTFKSPNGNIPIKNTKMYFTSNPLIGNMVAAAGNYSLAENWKTSALGAASHAEGGSTIAASTYAHAEGKGTVAGWAAHAQGCATRALGECASSAGRTSLADGKSSFSTGNWTAATDELAQAHGYAAISKDTRSYVWNGSSQYSKWFSINPGAMDNDSKTIQKLDAEIEKTKNEDTLDDVHMYMSHGKGTFNINPENGLSGFYIGDDNFIDCVLSAIGQMSNTQLAALKTKLGI